MTREAKMVITKKPRMTEAELKKSLSLWERRLEYRTDRLMEVRRAARSGAGKATAGVVTVPEAKWIKKWENLIKEARYWVDRRNGELAWYRNEARKMTPRRAAVRRALLYPGKVVERPSGSNSGPYISTWQRHTAHGATYLVGQPWCGVFCENMARHSGVKTSPRWASVAFIEDDARRHRSGFRGWTNDPKAVIPGDLVVLFGRGIHVEMVIEVRMRSGIIVTVGGNTSPGSGGSQSNGGGVYKRYRSFSEVHGFALVHYPNK